MPKELTCDLTTKKMCVRPEAYFGKCSTCPKAFKYIRENIHYKFLGGREYNIDILNEHTLQAEINYQTISGLHATFISRVEKGNATTIFEGSNTKEFLFTLD